MKGLLNANMGVDIHSEWSPMWIAAAPWTASPYVSSTTSPTGLITPEFRTTPGWSGGNQIPLSTTGIGSVVTVNFQPLSPNMTCQLCYRTRTGAIVYSKVVNGGDCSLKLNSSPANNIVFAVVSNTDYVYEGDATRKKHFDYRLQIVKGITAVASRTNRWYDWTMNYVADEIPSPPTSAVLKFKNPIQHGEDLSLVFDQSSTAPTEITIRNLYGQIVFQQQIEGSTTLSTNKRLQPGLYLVSSRCSGKEYVQKLIVK